jgi:hypothetical protein
MTVRTATLEKYYEEHPWHDVMANDAFLLAESTHPITLETLKDAAGRLGSRLCIATSYEAQARESAANAVEKSREELIAEISAYGKGIDAQTGEATFAAFSASGNRVQCTTKSLHALSLADLIKIATPIVARTQAKAMTTAEVRKAIAQLQPEPTAPAEVQVINPETKVEYTARELKQLNKNQYRALLFHPSGIPRNGVAERITKILKGLA